MANGWYGVDLDGTLAEYHGNHEEIGPPVPAMLERVKGWLAEGRNVRIVTARVSGLDSSRGAPEAWDARTLHIARQRVLIERWCQEHLGQVIPIQCHKDYAMIALYDDRAVQVLPNRGELLDDLNEMLRGAIQRLEKNELAILAESDELRAERDEARALAREWVPQVAKEFGTFYMARGVDEDQCAQFVAAMKERYPWLEDAPDV